MQLPTNLKVKPLMSCSFDYSFKQLSS